MYTDRFKELFEKIYAYAKTMERPAMVDNQCLYRSVYGPCLVGHVISDEEAAASGSYDFLSAFDEGCMPSLSWMNQAEQDMMANIQNSHDHIYFPGWNALMMQFLDELRKEIYAV